MSLRVKYNIFVILLLASAIGILSYLTLTGIKTYQEEQLEGYLAGQARTAHVLMGEKLTAEKAQEIVRQLSVDKWMGTAVYDMKGTLIASSQFLGNTGGLEAVNQHTKAMNYAKSGKIAYSKDIQTQGVTDSIVDYYAPLMIGEEQAGVLQLTYRYQTYQIFYEKMKNRISIAATAVFIFSLTVGLIFFGRLSKAVKTLEKSVDSVGAGKRKGVTLLKRKDELGRLSEGISEMSDTIFNQIDTLEEEQMKLNLAIDKLKAMEAKQRQFFGNITHEFKTPLSVINAYNDLTEMYPDDRELLETTHRQIRSEVNRLTQMVEQSLELAKLERYDFEIRRDPVDLKILLEEVIERLSVKAEKYLIAMSLQVKGEAKTILYSDQEALSQILVNVIDNSIKYNRREGWIQLELSSEKEEISLTVKDNGIGMSAEMCEQIFEPFSNPSAQNLTEVKGSGLGLALVKRLIEELGGSIAISSEEGFGTVVKMSWIRYNLETSRNDLETHS